MGVPAFFKWLILRYPKIVIDANDENNKPSNLNLNYDYLPDNSNTQPEVDNLYFDLNGLIHPCCHPIDRPQPDSIEEMFNDIYEYIDRLIKIVKPKKLIYFAIDGVAPKAKMNQQRARRFRSALESIENKKNEAELRKKWKRKGLILDEEEEKFHFDSNIITPGTEFMEKLSHSLEIYISKRLQFDSNWKDRIVIYSDSNVPGEGEHKILDFIRKQRSIEDYDPNTSHCIYGADADLIMLSLITHEPNFIVIRESIKENTYKKCEGCGKNGHLTGECPLKTGKKEDVKGIKDIEFSILKVGVLREYLQIEFGEMSLPFEYDFERIIDDFVMMCFFVGNDFLPHLPSLKIREGGLDALVYLYKHMLPKLKGYITDKGIIDLNGLEKIFEVLSLIEDEFFRNLNKENQVNLSKKQYYKQKKEKEMNILKEFEVFEAEKVFQSTKNTENIEEIQLENDFSEIESLLQKADEKYDEKNKKILVSKSVQYKNENSYINQMNSFSDQIKKDPKSSFNALVKEFSHQKRKEIEEKYEDPVKLGEDGWKERYYLSKFNVSSSDKEFIDIITLNYIEGLCWVYQYYYNGCPSWSWYYAFHYAPFISDLTKIKDLKIVFSLNEPLLPVEQLLAVLPPASKSAIPKCLHEYMTSPNSELADIFPSTIELDINGQPFAWMGVNLIPFFDNQRIKSAVKSKISLFSSEEIMRNVKNNEYRVYTTWENKSNGKVSLKGIELTQDSKSLPYKNDMTNTKLSSKLSIQTVKNCVVSSFLPVPTGNSPFKSHKSQLLAGVKFPTRVVYEDNIEAYSKKSFKGDFSIELVKRVLKEESKEKGYIQEWNDYSVKNKIFDERFNNNNRGIELNPVEVDLLRRKRYQDSQSRVSNHMNHMNNGGYQSSQGYNQKNYHSHSNGNHHGYMNNHNNHNNYNNRPYNHNANNRNGGQIINLPIPIPFPTNYNNQQRNNMNSTSKPENININVGNFSQNQGQSQNQSRNRNESQGQSKKEESFDDVFMSWSKKK